MRTLKKSRKYTRRCALNGFLVKMTISRQMTLKKHASKVFWGRRDVYAYLKIWRVWLGIGFLRQKKLETQLKFGKVKEHL